MNLWEAFLLLATAVGLVVLFFLGWLLLAMAKETVKDIWCLGWRRWWRLRRG